MIVTWMLIMMITQMVPIENLNGRKKVEAGELCERKNGIAVSISYFSTM